MNLLENGDEKNQQRMKRILDAGSLSENAKFLNFYFVTNGKESDEETKLSEICKLLNKSSIQHTRTMSNVKLVLQGFLDLCQTMKNYCYDELVQKDNLLELSKTLSTENCPNFVQTLSIQLL